MRNLTKLVISLPLLMVPCQQLMMKQAYAEEILGLVVELGHVEAIANDLGVHASLVGDHGALRLCAVENAQLDVGRRPRAARHFP